MLLPYSPDFVGNASAQQQSQTRIQCAAGHRFYIESIEHSSNFHWWMWDVMKAREPFLSSKSVRKKISYSKIGRWCCWNERLLCAQRPLMRIAFGFHCAQRPELLPTDEQKKIIRTSRSVDIINIISTNCCTQKLSTNTNSQNESLLKMLLCSIRAPFEDGDATRQSLWDE